MKVDHLLSASSLVAPVPHGWQLATLRRFLREPLAYGANESAVEINPEWPRYIRITDFGPDGLLNPDTFRSLPVELASPYLLQDGDILLARSGATVGKSFLYRKEFGTACYAGYLIRARFQLHKLIPEFAGYFFQSPLYWNQIRQGAIQATIENVSAEKYADMVIAVPPVRIQREIVEYLDRETAKIDALIDEKERLLKLLDERRQALITQAVTRGLDPTAPLKPSGHPWLGDIPAHWDVKPFGSIATVQEGPGILATDFRDVGVPLLRISGMQGSAASLEGCDFLDEQMVRKKWQHFRIRAEDILLSGSATSGLACDASPEVVGAVPYTGIFRMGAKPGNSREFLKLGLRAATVLSQLESVRTGSTMQHFGPEHLRKTRWAVPSIDEQQSVTREIASAEQFIDNSVGQVLQAVRSLRERRSSLIHEAVSGQLAR